MNLGLVIYDESVKGFVPVIGYKKPEAPTKPGYELNPLFTMARTEGFHLPTFEQAVGALRTWGLQGREIVTDAFAWTHELTPEFFNGLELCAFRGGQKHKHTDVWTHNSKVRFNWADASYGENFQQVPKAIGVVSQGQFGAGALPMLFTLASVADPNSTDDRHVYKYLERTERTLPTTLQALAQFSRMSYRPTAFYSVGALPVRDFEMAEIQLRVSRYTNNGGPEIRIKEELIDIKPLTYTAPPKGMRAAL